MPITVLPDWKARFQALLEEHPTDLVHWLTRWSDLEKALVEAQVHLYCTHLADTADVQAKAEFDAFHDDDYLTWQHLRGQLQAKALTYPPPEPSLEPLWHKFKLTAQYRHPEASALDAEAQQRAHRFAGLQAGVVFSVEGRPSSRAELLAGLASENAAQREASYHAWMQGIQASHAEAAQLYLELIGLRQQAARHAGAPSYLEYRRAQMARSDHTPKRLAQFRTLVRTQVCPRLVRLRQRRASLLGQDAHRLRPWDTQVLPGVGEHLTVPFSGEGFEQEVGEVLEGVDPEFAARYHDLLREGWLDLHPRPGKAEFAFMETYMVRHRPWVSTPGHATLWRMTDTLHELGHALHRLLVSSDELFWNITAPTEYQEFVAQAVEALGLEGWMARFAPPMRPVLRLAFWERALAMVVSTTAIDEFQTWAYQQDPETLTPEDLFAQYSTIRSRYPDGLDWTGLEEYQGLDWLRINTFDQPLYMIEYALAWTAVFQLWARYRDAPQEALETLKDSMRQGGHRQTLTALFDTAGVALWLNPTQAAAALDRLPLGDAVPMPLREVPAGETV